MFFIMKKYKQREVMYQFGLLMSLLSFHGGN